MFKVGDRVEAVTDGGFTATKGQLYPGVKGIVVGLSQSSSLHHVDFDGVDRNPWPMRLDELKLITEEPMTVITALQQSITHWQEIVAVFGGVKVEDDLAQVALGPKNCPLCHMVGNDRGVDCKNCSKCPLESCQDGTLYSAVVRTETNPDAYTASKAMLARLEELLVEEQAKAKKEEAAIRVGDIVFNSVTCESISDVPHYSGVVSDISRRGVVHYARATGQAEKGGCYAEDLTLIHRPTKEAK